MSDSDYEPISRPSSAINDAFSNFCQVSLINEALEKNPHPRQDYYRQFSVTPERQTPESQRTPWWPTPDPQEYKAAIGEAQKAKDSLARFYAGRLILKDDPEDSIIYGCDPPHWRSKAKEWTDEVHKLQKQYETRIQQERRRKAKKGYAQALLLSPLHSPPLSGGRLPRVIRLLKIPAAKNNEIRKQISTRPSKSGTNPSQGKSQPTAVHNTTSNLRTSQKRTRTEVETNEEETLDQTSCTKRQRREVTTVSRKQEPVSVSKSTRGLPKSTSKISKSKATGGLKRKKLGSKGKESRPKEKKPALVAPVTQRNLPWNLRSRGVTSDREIGMGTAFHNRRRPGKKNVNHKKPPLRGK